MPLFGEPQFGDSHRCDSHRCDSHSGDSHGGDPHCGDLPRTPSRTLPARSSLVGKLLAVFGTVVSTGCTGPTTFVENPGEHPTYVDGRAERRSELPFRYYGTRYIDVVPADQQREPEHDPQPGADLSRRADFSHRAQRLRVAMQPPAAPWLFPLDFPLELIHWAFAGQPDLTVAIAPPEVAPEDRVSPDYKPVGLELVTERALQARISR